MKILEKFLSLQNMHLNKIHILFNIVLKYSPSYKLYFIKLRQKYEKLIELRQFHSRESLSY